MYYDGSHSKTWELHGGGPYINHNMRQSKKKDVSAKRRGGKQIKRVVIDARVLSVVEVSVCVCVCEWK